MANLQQMMNDEIRRLARKELKTAFVPLLKSVSEQRKQIIELRKQLRELQNRLNIVAPAPAAAPAAVAEDAAKKLRLTPERIRNVREKYGISRKDFAALLDVALISVGNWENGKTAPRLQQKQKIAEIRAMGKRELKAALAAKGLKLNEKKAAKAKKATPAPAPAK